MEEKRGSPWLEFLGTLTVAGLGAGALMVIGAMLCLINVILMYACIGVAILLMLYQVGHGGA